MGIGDGVGGRLDLPDVWTDEDWRRVSPHEHARRLVASGVAVAALAPYLRRALTTLSGDGRDAAHSHSETVS